MLLTTPQGMLKNSHHRGQSILDVSLNKIGGDEERGNEEEGGMRRTGEDA